MYVHNCQRLCLKMTTLNSDLVFHMQNFPFALYLRSTMFLRMCLLSKSAWKPTETAMTSSLFSSVQEATSLTLPQVNTQSCYKVVIRLLRGCHKVVEGCHKVVVRLLQGCYKVVTRLLQGCHKVVEGCHKVVVRLLQGCYKVVTRL